MIYKLQFWTLVAGVLAYVAKYFLPDMPFGETEILAGVLFILGLVGIVPQARAHAIVAGDILKSKAFWALVVGLVGFVVRFYAPNFPFSDAVVLGVVVYILNRFGINPELMVNGVLDEDYF